MKTKSAKAKGRRLQDWVRQKLIEYLVDLDENLEDNISTAVMGAAGADVKFTPQTQHLFPYSIECKNQEKYSSVYNAIDQASNHSRFPPIVFLKMNKRKPLVVIDAEDFLDTWSCLMTLEMDNGGATK